MLLKSVLLIAVFKKDIPFSKQQLFQIIQDLRFLAKKIKRLTGVSEAAAVALGAIADEYFVRVDVGTNRLEIGAGDLFPYERIAFLT